MPRSKEKNREYNQRYRARRKQWKKDNPEKVRVSKAKYNNSEHRKDYLLKWFYGISLEDRKSMEASQRFVCAICKAEDAERVLDVDHDHTTGKVRGLLCRSCNLGLGHFKDDPIRLAAAIQYLTPENT